MKKIYGNLAISQAIEEEMLRDDKVVLIGHDQGRYGGSFGVTQTVYDRFGSERVFDMPISEGGFTGLAVGAAITGLRPIMEVQFNDWITLAMDQLVNNGSILKYMTGGAISVPMVLRTNCGGYLAGAAQHSKMMESMLAYFPGIKVVMGSTPADMKGLMKAAIRDNNPVICLEHKKLYGMRGEVSEDPELIVPIGKADVKKPGTDVSIITYSYEVHLALKAAKELAEEGISVEVLDLRTIRPLDQEAILQSVSKTGRALCLTEGYAPFSVMSEVSAIIAENIPGALKKPVIRYGAKDCPIPYSPVLENFVLPDVEGIKAAVRTLMQD